MPISSGRIFLQRVFSITLAGAPKGLALVSPPNRTFGRTSRLSVQSHPLAPHIGLKMALFYHMVIHCRHSSPTLMQVVNRQQIFHKLSSLISSELKPIRPYGLHQCTCGSLDYHIMIMKFTFIILFPVYGFFKSPPKRPCTNLHTSCSSPFYK